MTTEFNTNTTRTERTIVRRLIDAILASGYVVSVNDGEDIVIKQSDNKAAILAVLASTDSDTLIVRDKDGQKICAFWLIWGNDEDVISDYTSVPEADRLCHIAQEMQA